MPGGPTPTCASWPGPEPNPYTYQSIYGQVTYYCGVQEGWSCARWHAEFLVGLAAFQEIYPPAGFAVRARAWFARVRARVAGWWGAPRTASDSVAA